MEWISKALNIHPFADLLYKQGWCYEQLGEKEQAISAYTKSLLQNREEMRSYIRLAALQQEDFELLTKSIAELSDEDIRKGDVDLWVFFLGR